MWAGKHGFRSDEVLAAARDNTGLKGKLHILATVSDVDLRALLRSCWCTIYPSHVEGWGLPVAESLAFGKPCLAAGTSSIPEVGGSLAWYFDPNDVDEATNLVLSLIEEPQRVSERAQEIQRKFQRRSWAEVALAFEAAVSGLATSSRSRPVTDLLQMRPGQSYTACSLAERTPLSLNEAFVRQTMFNEGWYAAETWGRWMRQPGGALHLHLPRFAGAKVCRVYLAVVTMQSWRGRALRIACRETGFEAVAAIKAGRAYRLLVDLPLAGGLVDLELTVDRFDPVIGTDPRLLSIGIVEVGVVHNGEPGRAECDGARAPGQTIKLRARPIGTAPSGLERWRARVRRVFNLE